MTSSPNLQRVLPTPLHWYVALVVVIGVGGVFASYIARDGRREWLRSGRTGAEYDERLKQHRRRHLPRALLCAALFLLAWLGGFPYYLGLVPMLVFVSSGLYDLWEDRARLTKDRSWRINALWQVVLVLVLSGLTGLVMPFLLRLP